MGELVRSLAISMAGLIVGWFLGTAYCQWKAASEDDRPHPSRWLGGRFLGIAIIVLAVVTTAMASVTSYEQQRQSQCFRDYNRDFVTSYTARVEAANKDRNALNALIISLDNPDPVARQTIFRNYIANIRITDAERAKHPVPTPPDPKDYCG